MKYLFVLLFTFVVFNSYGQDLYKDSLTRYINNYVEKHEVVTGDDKKHLHFYPIDEQYKVKASFEKVNNGKWFRMETSGTIKQTFRVYGIAKFTVHDTTVRLNIYQSQNLATANDYKNYLFLPFTDATTGETTYSAGRYIDLETTDVKNNTVIIDFNKAYNPYCAYVSGKYNCPIPPKENTLAVAIEAGEKNFGKEH